MNKKIIIIVLLLIGLPIAWWLISPFWNDVTLNEELPQSQTVSDNLDSMNKETMENFVKETEMMKDKGLAGKETMPLSETTILSRATMVERAHGVKGEALLIKTGGETYLRFENLETINGPDLRIYLSSDLSNNDIVDLGPIRATNGNVNYVIPAGVDLSKYKNAMIWCRAFGVLFSYAQFK